MLKRKINDILINWKKNENKKALLVKGCRQVGKTTSIRKFGNENYKCFVELNFERNPSYKKIFDGDLDARTILLNISSVINVEYEIGNTLFFFDEIQSCPNARTAIKFLVEDGRYDYIESGSLLGINYKDVSSYPVGYEEQISMYPLDFEEFLWSKDIKNDVLDYLLECYQSKLSVSPIIHDTMLKHFNEFIIVGGMPAAVNEFINTDNLNNVIRIQKMILNGYRDDIAKYAGSHKTIAKKVFDSIIEQLSKENKRFIFNKITSSSSNRQLAEPTLWLADACMSYYCNNINSIEIPLSFGKRNNLYKMYLGDVGLLCAMSLNNIQSELLYGNISINSGGILENAIAMELVKKEIPLYYYDKKSRQELDFVYEKNNKVTIIEVKSGADYKKHTSLDNAINTYQNLNQSIVLCTGNVCNTNEILYLPFYLIMFI